MQVLCLSTTYIVLDVTFHQTAGIHINASRHWNHLNHAFEAFSKCRKSLFKDYIQDTRVLTPTVCAK